MQAFDDVDLVFGLGPAGTGKTYLAVAYAAQCLERGEVERIVLSRPAVEAGERLGFLPGDMKEKVDPYLRPLYDALYDLLPPAKVERDLATGVIEIAPLAFMRGRTLAHSFVILDEAQNTTSMQMKMFLTRIGEGSKMAVTGDPSQVDLPSGQRSGLEEAVTLLPASKASRRFASHPRTWCAAISSPASSTPTTKRSRTHCSHEHPRRQYALHARRLRGRPGARAFGSLDHLNRQRAGRLERLRPPEQAIDAAAAALARIAKQHAPAAPKPASCWRTTHGARLERDLSRQGRRDQRLSFPFQTPPGGVPRKMRLSGRCRAGGRDRQREAAERGIAPTAHLQHLVVHGLLHLLGFDHTTDAEAEQMERIEAEILATLGIADPYAEPLA